jgi:hypothetical protein
VKNSPDAGRFAVPANHAATKIVIVAFAFSTAFSSSKISAQSNEPADLPDIEDNFADLELLTPRVLNRGKQVQALPWQEPSYTPEEEVALLYPYENLLNDPQIPNYLLRPALLYYLRNLELIPNKDYLTLVNFTKHSRIQRLFLINLATRSYSQMHVSHGKGSDTDNDGYAEIFSNTPNSYMSSLGFALTAETYYGVRGYSLRIDGLSSTNSKVRERAVVVHGSDYVVDENRKQGRSLGCFVISWSNRTYLIDKIREGSLIYAGVSPLSELHQRPVRPANTEFK